MTVIPQERPDIEGVISRSDGLTILADLPFNAWRLLGRRLLSTTDRALWSLGDWWVYGQRYAVEYHDALQALEDSSRLIAASARVARAFESERRRGQLSFELHELVAGLPPAEQDRWLDDAERQGWRRRQLAFAFAERIPRVVTPALSLRLVEDYYTLALTAAERRGMDAKEWVLEAIREKAEREQAELEAA